METKKEDLTLLGVKDAVTALKKGVCSSERLIESCLAKIKSNNGKMNGFIHVETEQATRDALQSDNRRKNGTLLSPLDGVPLAVKDNIDILGQPTTNGLGMHWIPSKDAAIVKLLRNKGMVFLGKTNMHEAALGATTDNPHHGKCFNPLLEGHTPGGSSGGSGAVVSGYLCPAALGTDTMGSVRVPAAYCGIVGFKPTKNFWSTAGVTPLSVTLDTIGPLARSVSDIAFLSGLNLKNIDVKSCNVASLENFEYADMEDEIKSGYEETKKLLLNSGVSIGQARLSDYDPSSARRAGLLVSEVEACVLLEDFRLKSQEAFSPELQTMLDFGRRAPASRYFNAIQKIQTLKRELCSIFQKQKFVITPTTPQTPFPFSKDTPTNQADFTALANFCGCPAISLPLKRSGKSKPVGLQIMAGPGSDIDLLSFALGIEKLISNN